MLIRIRLGRRVVGSYRELIDLLPTDALASPRRSTVPLIDYWRDAEVRLAELSEILGIDLQPPVDLDFEFSVPVARGRGKASFTDLMVTTDSAVLAIEAKFTEPRYESVQKWLRTPPEANRSEVLEGWLDLIAKATSRRLQVAQVLPLPYQLIHRAASVCFVERPIRAVVYQVFGDKPVDYYTKALSEFRRLLGIQSELSLHVLACPAESLEPHLPLETMSIGSPLLVEAVRKALRSGPLFRFDKPCLNGPEY